MDTRAACVAIHVIIDAHSLVATASRARLREQKETIHMIQMLRQEACSGQIEELAHVVSADCLSDWLRKASAKPDSLIKAVTTGVIPIWTCIHNSDHV